MDALQAEQEAATGEAIDQIEDDLDQIEDDIEDAQEVLQRQNVEILKLVGSLRDEVRELRGQINSKG